MFLGKVGVSIRRENLLAGQFDRFSAIFVLIEEEDNYKGETAWLSLKDFTHCGAGTHQDAILKNSLPI